MDSPLGRSGDAPPKHERKVYVFQVQSQCYASSHSSILFVLPLEI